MVIQFMNDYIKCLLCGLILLCLSCKRNHTSVLVNVVDNDTGSPIQNAKVEVIRKGRKGFFTDKSHLVVGTDFTNTDGQVLVNFKYDRGNKYALFVYAADAAGGYYQNGDPQYFDLEKGKNEETVYMDQQSYLKINFKSNNPVDKFLHGLTIEDVTNTGIKYSKSYNNSSPVDTTIFRMVAARRGNRNIIWEVDSAGFEKTYSLPIELKGHDTTYATLNF